MRKAGLGAAASIGKAPSGREGVTLIEKKLLSADILTILYISTVKK